MPPPMSFCASVCDAASGLVIAEAVVPVPTRGRSQPGLGGRVIFSSPDQRMQRTGLRPPLSRQPVAVRKAGTA